MAQVIGRLTKDAEVKTTETGKQLVQFSLAENFKYKTKNGEKKEDATFFNCTLWNRTKIAQYLKKGTVISIEGKLFTNVYTDKEGKPKASMKFTVRKLDFLPSSTSKKTNKSEAAPPEESIDDLPF